MSWKTIVKRTVEQVKSDSDIMRALSDLQTSLEDVKDLITKSDPEVSEAIRELDLLIRNAQTLKSDLQEYAD